MGRTRFKGTLRLGQDHHYGVSISSCPDPDKCGQSMVQAREPLRTELGDVSYHTDGAASQSRVSKKKYVAALPHEAKDIYP